MTSASRFSPFREINRDEDARLRAQGLRPITIWVPDIRSPEFRADAHRQSLAAAAAPMAGDDEAFIAVAVDRAME